MTPTVVDSGSALGVPSNRKFRSLIIHAAPTTTGIFTPAGILSGIGTAGPVKLAVTAGTGVGVGVPAGVVVATGVGVAAGVGVGVGTGPVPHENTSENARTEPVSRPALSLAFSVHVPIAFWPSNADSGLFGENVPEGNAAAEFAPH